MDLLDRSEDDPDVLEAKDDVKQSQQVIDLFRHQQADGSWEGRRHGLFTTKGTVYSLLLLGELGVTGDERTQRALDYLGEYFQRDSGIISYRQIKTSRGRQSKTTNLWCVTPITLRAALLLGHTEHSVVKHALNFLEAFHEAEGGWSCRFYSRDPKKVRPPNCYLGTIKVLNALSLIPSSQRTRKQREIIAKEVTTCLENRVHMYRVDRQGHPTAKRSWLKFGFPRNWRSDALEAVDVLTQLGIRSSNLTETLDLIRSKKQPDGCWLHDYSPSKEAWIKLEEEGAPSKWITLRALRILKRIT
jgi:hypothetical protein